MTDIAEPWTISHDFFYQIGGAERVTASLSRSALPYAEVQAIAGRTAIAEHLGIPRMRFVGRAPYSEKNYRELALLSHGELSLRRPLETHLLSSSYAFAHHLPAEGNTVVYCHSPLRQIWSGADMYRSNGHAQRIAITAFGALARRHDKRMAKRAHAYIATNSIVRDRIREAYDLDPIAIIAPPIDARFFSTPKPRKDYFLWAGRIVEPYKKLGLVLETFRDRPDRLIVAGDGRDRERLERTAPKNVTFVGAQSTGSLAALYSEAKGFIFSSEDDFGMVPLEAMASGTPVVAWNAGGAALNVVEGTGLLYKDADTRSLGDALRAFERTDWDHSEISRHAGLYSEASFASQIRSVLAWV